MPLADLQRAFFWTNRFREDGGRLYNAAQDDYSLPADMQEINRLNIQHVAYCKVSRWPCPRRGHPRARNDTVLKAWPFLLCSESDRTISDQWMSIFKDSPERRSWISDAASSLIPARSTPNSLPINHASLYQARVCGLLKSDGRFLRQSLSVSVVLYAAEYRSVLIP
jgi:hypothetical protein